MVEHDRWALTSERPWATSWVLLPHLWLTACSMTCYQLLILSVGLNIKLLEIEWLEGSPGHDLGETMPVRGTIAPGCLIGPGQCADQ